LSNNEGALVLKVQIKLLFPLIVIGIVVLNACSGVGAHLERQQIRNEINELNQYGIRFMEKGDIEEAIWNFKEAEKLVYKLDPSFKDIQEEIDSTEVMDSAFNNLSWAYHDLGEYDLGLEYINKSLMILPNTDIEYVNKGNTLFGLERYEEALEQYKEALLINKDSRFAYYGKGSVLYELEKYEEAIEAFDRFLTIKTKDLDAAIYKVDSHLFLNQTQLALEFADDFIEQNKEKYEVYRLKANVLEFNNDYDALKVFYEETSQYFPDVFQAQLDKAELEYDYGYYNSALNHYKTLLEAYPNEVELYVGMINNYSALGQFDNAKLAFKESLKFGSDSSEKVYNAIGNANIDYTSYMEAIPQFDRAIELNPEIEDSYLNKLYALYHGKRYAACIQFGEEAEEAFPLAPNIPWFIGECYLELDQYEQAIKNYKKTLALDPDNDEVLASIAYAYLYSEAYEKAEEYSQKSLDVYSENGTALFVMETVQDKETSLGRQIGEFFDESYLYQMQSNDYEEKLTKLKELKGSGQDIIEAIEDLRVQDDWFTFVVYGADYDNLIQSSDNDIEYSESYADLVYLKIKDFTKSTDDQVIEYLDAVQHKGEKGLVIDLRGNLGGYTDSANNILDILLPEYVTSSLIYRDGYAYNYYSDASYMEFDEIYILVDEKTASAAELLTLGLKSYLNDVIILGRNTFGKGVGQRIFEDKANKIMVFVTNHHWNVKQANIMNKGIAPDVYVAGDDVEDFMKQVLDRWEEEQ
jgi:tetratricopeptide (TPR) repeat protein